MRRALSGMLTAALTASLLVTGVGAGSTAVAAEGEGTVLPVRGFADIEADPVHGHEFITGGPGVDTVLVADVDGNIVDTLDDLPGASDMVITPDHSTLYVSLNRGDGIAAIDTETFARRVLPTGPDSCPRSPALAAGLVWYLSDCAYHPGGSRSFGLLEALDPRTGAVHRWASPVESEGIASSPVSRPRMLTSSNGVSLTRLQLPAVSSDPVEVAATRVVYNGQLTDFLVTPDGRRVLTTGGAAHGQVFDSHVFASVDSYPSAHYPNALAMRADGTVAVGDSDADGYSEDVTVYAPGQTVFPARHDFGTDIDDITLPRQLAAKGLAFGATRLYAVTVDSRATTWTLRVLDGDAPATPPLGTNQLRVPAVHQVLADPAHRRAFVSVGNEGNGVFVVDITGRVTAVLQHLPGATQMVLDPVRSTVYVALATGSAIAAIDTRTLKVRRLPTGPESCPASVALAADLVWFTHNCYAIGSWLGAVDPVTGSVHARISQWHEVPIYSSSTHPNVLIGTRNEGVAGAAQQTLVRGGSRPTVRPVRSAVIGAANLDTALTPDGLHAIFAAPYLAVHVVLQTVDLSLAALSVSDYSPLAVATRSDGLVAKGVGYDNDTSVRGPRHRFTVALQGSALGATVGYVHLPEPFLHRLVPRGLAFAAKNLFVVNKFSTGFAVTVHRMPPLRKVSLTTDLARYPRGATVRVVAHVDPSLPGRVRNVSISTRTEGSRRNVLLARRAPNGSGNVSAAFRITRPTTISTVVTTSRGAWRTSRSRAPLG